MVFFCTDNSTVEAALYYKGTAMVPLTTIRLWIVISTSHVSGNQMIAQGTDGLLRGLLNKGVMAGESFFALVPFNLLAALRSPSLVPWFRSWVGNDLIHPQQED